MSYNRNFYNNRQNDFTFQNVGPQHYVPPPPPPPHLFLMSPPPIQHITNREIADHQFIKQFEHAMPIESNTLIGNKPKTPSISVIRDKIKDLVININEIKSKESELTQKINTCTDEEWQMFFKDINHRKSLITNMLSSISNYLSILQKLLKKRAAKRLRLKRQKLDRQKEKEDWIKNREERSRKIDENLQKIKDEIVKAQKDEMEKIEADHILKEVRRKKYDARKCVMKLDALEKLRKARMNTAKGRGQCISEEEMISFNNRISNLKSLWAQKYINYEEEEQELHAKLKTESSQTTKANDVEKEKISCSIGKWKKDLFGAKDTLPQVDFKGDMGKFVSIRWQWDSYLSEDGTPLPIGWVVPDKPI